MAVSVNTLQQMYPDARMTRGVNGVEIILRHCPLDLRGLGRQHPDYKVYINPLLGVAKCFVCHGDGEGCSVETIVGRKLRSVEAPGSAPKVHRPPVIDMPTCTLLTDLSSSHPAHRYLADRSVTVDTAHNCGMMWKDEYTHAWLDADGEPKMRGLAGFIIPMRVRGKLMAWQFAPIPRVDFLPKYINAPSSRMDVAVFNWDNVHNSSDKLVVVEGLFDSLRIPDISVAIMGSSITDHKQRLISTGHFSEIILCMDPDDAGRKMTKKNLSKLMGLAPVVRSVSLPPGKDPGDYDEAELREVLGV